MQIAYWNGAAEAFIFHFSFFDVAHLSTTYEIIPSLSHQPQPHFLTFMSLWLSSVLLCPYPASVIYTTHTRSPRKPITPSDLAVAQLLLSFCHFELHASFLITSLLTTAEFKFLSPQDWISILLRRRVGVVFLRCWSQHLSSTFKALSVPESREKKMFRQLANLSVSFYMGRCCTGSLFRSDLESVGRNSFPSLQLVHTHIHRREYNIFPRGEEYLSLVHHRDVQGSFTGLNCHSDLELVLGKSGLLQNKPYLLI